MNSEGDSSEIKVTDELKLRMNFPWMFSTKHCFEKHNKNDRSPCSLKRCDGPILPNGQFQKISIPNHGRLPIFNPPLPSEIPKCITPPCPQNSIIVNPPSRSEFLFFFWKYIFDLATALWTNKREYMPPQGCDFAAPGDHDDKLYSSATRKT